MNTDEFWAIIDDAGRAQGGHEKFLAAVKSVLRKLPPAEIIEFKLRFEEQMERSFRWDVWGAAHIIRGWCTDDGFEYFRAWLISQGRRVFEEAVANPESLATLSIETDCDFEDLIFVAGDEYGAMTGGDMYEALPKRSRHPRIEPAGEPWGEDPADLERRFPRLWAKFHGKT